MVLSFVYTNYGLDYYFIVLFGKSTCRYWSAWKKIRKWLGVFCHFDLDPKNTVNNQFPVT